MASTPNFAFHRAVEHGRRLDDGQHEVGLVIDGTGDTELGPIGDALDHVEQLVELGDRLPADRR